jgi:hypothetical protein
MRKIVADLFISLDGVIEDAGQWTGPLAACSRMWAAASGTLWHLVILPVFSPARRP